MLRNRGRLLIATAAKGFVLTQVVFLTGCMGVKSGGGPLSPQKAQLVYGVQFRSLPEEERTRFEKIEERLNAKLAAKPEGTAQFARLAFGGAPRIKSQSASKGAGMGVLIAGFWNHKIRFVDRITTGSDSVLLYSRDNACIPGFPLAWPLWFDGSEIYLAKSGEQIGDRSFFGLGLSGIIGGHWKAIAPAYDSQSAATQIREANQFNVLKMTWLAGGILGYGRANNKYYGQILWIAFPVGDAKSPDDPAQSALNQ